MRGADQQVAIAQETARRVVQSTALVRTDIEPGRDPAVTTMQDDRHIFAVDDDICGTDLIFRYRHAQN